VHREPAVSDLTVDERTALRELKTQLTRFMMSYKFATDEMMTKINILKEEFSSIHAYSPIEHVRSRLKSPEGILKKALRTGCPLTLDEIRDHIQDIAGIRITCSFISDTYRVCQMLTSQQDVTVLKVKDYIASPKPNGYKSLHVLATVPVFMSDRVQPVTVEIQIRTIAMDFWATLEHKIYYKYDGAVPAALLVDLKQAADVASRLDVKMERLHEQVVKLAAADADASDWSTVNLDWLSQLSMSKEVLEAFSRGRAGAPAPRA
jgi:putative GTP pyrophosphokinase